MNTSWIISDFDEAESNKILNEISLEVDKFREKWSENNEYLNSPEVLGEALDDYEKLREKLGFGNEFIYSVWLRLQLNQSSSELKAKLNLVEDYLTKLENKISFFTINLSKIDVSKQKDILN